VGTVQDRVAVPVAAVPELWISMGTFAEELAPLALKHARVNVLVAVNPFAVLLPSRGSEPLQDLWAWQLSAFLDDHLSVL
jgi:hypothetical protein